MLGSAGVGLCGDQAAWGGWPWGNEAAKDGEALVAMAESSGFS